VDDERFLFELGRNSKKKKKKQQQQSLVLRT